MNESFWSSYFRSLKPLEVEEPVDVWIHRPPAFLLARLLLPTRASPNAITVLSIALGVLAGVFVFVDVPFHLVVAGSLVFSSAVLDCADGQLARMRKSSSAYGRMLDGIGDFVGSTLFVGGAAWLILRKYQSPPALLAVAAVLTTLTILTGSFHTTMYDQYKNLFLRMTHPSYREGEDLAAAGRRFQEEKPRLNWVLRVTWVLYFFYLRSQERYADAFDPDARRFAAEFPEYDPRNASIYRKHAGGLMRIWRSLFGFGSLVFGLAVSIGCDRTDWYLAFRFVFLNALFYGYLRPAQRRASRRALAEMATPA